MKFHFLFVAEIISDWWKRRKLPSLNPYKIWGIWLFDEFCVCEKYFRSNWNLKNIIQIVITTKSCQDEMSGKFSVLKKNFKKTFQKSDNFALFFTFSNQTIPDLHLNTDHTYFRCQHKIYFLKKLWRRSRKSSRRLPAHELCSTLQCWLQIQTVLIAFQIARSSSRWQLLKNSTGWNLEWMTSGGRREEHFAQLKNSAAKQVAR